MLRTGLATAAWISVDDTGATCTRIGDHRFASFATTPAKSRLKFIELLAGAEPACTVNAEALAYMRKRQLPEALIARLAAQPNRDFPTEQPCRCISPRPACRLYRVTPTRRGASEGARLGAGLSRAASRTP